MTKHKRLKLMGEADRKLGRTTIMDRALAQKYGAVYVHAAAFAIDIDRVNQRSSEDDPNLPFGWDVLLTDLYLCEFVAPRPEAVGLLDDFVLSVLDLSEEANEPPLGSQLPFAVFAALSRGALPDTLHSCFRSWKKPPLELAADVARWREDRALVARLCEHCLTTPIEPSLVAPVREALLALSRTQ